MKLNKLLLSQIPASLQDPLNSKLQELSKIPVEITDPEVENSLCFVWAISDFVAQACLSFPNIFKNLYDNQLKKSLGLQDYQQQLITSLANHDEIQFARQLRLLRKQHMVRIAWRDLAGWANLEQTLNDLSNFADSCILISINYLIKILAAKYGYPCDSDGNHQELLVIAMGKLGGHELNFSSDIDLIFAYSQEGMTNGNDKISCQEFFTKVVQKFIKLFSSSMLEGYVFRVDLRLRPNGEGGPLVISLSALENYYQEQGRDWERYAMVKARVLNNDSVATRRLRQILSSFVYRRYIDFSVVESLRSLKDLIQREVRVKGLDNDIKRGAGGIREIEFICQSLQLIRGGRCHQLQHQGLLTGFQRIKQEGLLDNAAIDELTTAYCFLRKLENYLQMQHDTQVHVLPNDPVAQQQLALAMRLANWQELLGVLNNHRALVSKHFTVILYPLQNDYQSQERLLDEQLLNLWNGRLEQNIAEDVLKSLGFTEDKSVYAMINALRQNKKFSKLSQLARHRLDSFMPLLLRYVSKVENSETTLLRIISLLEAVMQRSAYLALLTENIQALQHLIKLFSASNWIAEQLSTQPFLLEVLLESKLSYDLDLKASLSQKLQYNLLSLLAADYEQQAEELRKFKAKQVLQVAAAEIVGELNAEETSYYLTTIAEVILQQVFNLAVQELAHKYPEIIKVSTNFAIIAYGKLGACELNYNSDLDLVFLHANNADVEYYTTRLTQKILHLLNTRTAAGVLYQVDTRLRPSGTSGLLVSNIDAFEQYQQQAAWTWEHQALIRARFICGAEQLAQRFKQLRMGILATPRNMQKLQADIGSMRQRIRDNYAKQAPQNANLIDLKYADGGIIDIEFLMQFAVLAWGHQSPQLLAYSDNISIMQALASCKILSQATAQRLLEIYLKYRAMHHQLILQNQPFIVVAHEISEERKVVRELWQQWIAF